MPKDALTRRRGRRPAGFCQEQTLVMIEQCCSIERDVFHAPYLSDTTLVVPVKQTVTYRASFGHVELFQEYRKPLRSK